MEYKRNGDGKEGKKIKMEQKRYKIEKQERKLKEIEDMGTEKKKRMLK